MDRRISNIIKDWKTEARIEGIVQLSAFNSFKDTIYICTDSPGRMIGKAGNTLEKYKARLKEINSNLEHIKFIETDSWYIK